MKTLLTGLVFLLAATCLAAPEIRKPKRVIDIYIYETRRTDHSVIFYSWINDNHGGDCEIAGTCPEVEVGWLQAGSIYLENKGGSEAKGLQGQTMVFVTIAERDDNWVEGGSGKGLKIKFGKLQGGGWDGKIYIEVPYNSTFQVRRTVAIKKAE